MEIFDQEIVKYKQPNHSHAWKGAWSRPMHVDENSLHPLEVARMTDHNVRGMDEDYDEGLAESGEVEKIVEVVTVDVWEAEGEFR